MFGLVAVLLLASMHGGSMLLAADSAAPEPAAGLAAANGTRFQPSDDALSDVSRALDRARDNHRLLLVVMGANWCHDSRALASRLFEEPLQSLIAQNYETIFVDVGFLDQGRDVISRFGPPVYYATPTVLIVDPASGLLLNANNRHQWGNASKISMEESLAYFRQMATRNPEMSHDGTGEAEGPSGLLLEIDSFERLQAERLYTGYAFIGPLLRAYENGQSPDSFEVYWNELRDFRLMLAQDIDALRQEALLRVSAGEQ